MQKIKKKEKLIETFSTNSSALIGIYSVTVL